MKRKHINIVSLGLFLFMLNACDMDRIPESDLSDAIFWQTDNDFNQATAYLYRASHIDCCSDHWPRYADRLSDNAMGLNPNPISNGTYLPSANFGTWDNDYEVIRAANNILEKAMTSDIDPAILARYVGEARFFRANAYFNLVKRYGDVPLILKTLDTDDSELYAARTSREVVIDTVYQDLDFAAENLPSVTEMNVESEYGRVTSGTAFALKSRIALYEGTRQKFHAPANTTHPFDYHLQIAREASLQVIQSGEYELFDDYGTDSYRLLFKGEGEGPDNREAIWVYIYGFSNLNDVNTNNHQGQLLNGEMGATRSLVDAYLCADGLPIDKSPLYQGQQHANSEYIDRDPRLDGTIVKPGDLYFTAETPYVPELVAATGYQVEKYYNFRQDQLDNMLLRYAEVLLTFAEASFELNDAISDADLDISINLLRDRVGMPHLTNAFVAANGLIMREEIRRERRVELAIEGFRYDDLIRWKIAEVELPKPILGVRFFNAEYPADDPGSLNLTADSVVIVERAANRNFDPLKHYLWPLPLNQIALNPNLEQNPNW